MRAPDVRGDVLDDVFDAEPARDSVREGIGEPRVALESVFVARGVGRRVEPPAAERAKGVGRFVVAKRAASCCHANNGEP